jgi:hypothetical protein
MGSRERGLEGPTWVVRWAAVPMSTPSAMDITVTRASTIAWVPSGCGLTPSSSVTPISPAAGHEQPESGEEGHQLGWPGWERLHPQDQRGHGERAEETAEEPAEHGGADHLAAVRGEQHDEERTCRSEEKCR